MIKWIIALAALLFAIWTIAGCGSDEKNRKMRQYTSYGKYIYQRQCVNCHQTQGDGYEALYPPIAGADYFLEDPDRTICLIYNGHEGGLTVNGKDYDLPMPDFDHLKPDEMAKLMTYIGNAWGNNIGFIDEKRVTAALDSCSSIEEPHN